MNVSFGRTVVIRDNVVKNQVAADHKQISIIQKPEEIKKSNTQNTSDTQYEIWGNAPYPLMIVSHDPRNYNLTKIVKQINSTKEAGDDVVIVDINPGNKDKKEIMPESPSYEVFPRGRKHD